MFGIASIVAFALALVFQLAQFTITGLLCLAVHLVTGWWPTRRGT